MFCTYMRSLVLFVTLLSFSWLVKSEPAFNYQASSFSAPTPSGMTGSDFEIRALIGPGDIVSITGIGFGDRDLSDGVNESIYVLNPTFERSAQPYRGIFRQSRVDGDGKVIYYGLLLWTDTRIIIEVPKGEGGLLGNFIHLRRYTDLNDNVGKDSITGKMRLQVPSIPEPSTMLLLTPGILLLLMRRSTV